MSNISIMMADTLKQLRTNNALTIKDVSKSTGIPSKDIEEYEAGKGRIPRTEIIKVLADTYGVSLEAVLKEVYDE